MNETVLTRPQLTLLRRAAFRVHLWAGVLAGFYVLVVCATGAALVFRLDLQRALHPQLFTASASGVQADPVAVMESTRAAYPHGRLSGVDAPTSARPTYLAYVTAADRVLTVLIDPVSARVLGELPTRSLVRTLQDLHFDLLTGRTGRLVNGVGAIMLLALCLTGLVIGWPGLATGWRGFAVDFRRGWKGVTWELHRATGIWTGAIIAMWAATGIYFVFPSQFRATVNWISPVSVNQPLLSHPASAGAIPRQTWRTLLDRARQEVPDQHVARVVVPATDRDSFLVLFSQTQPTPVGTTRLVPVHLDQFTGAVLLEPPKGGRTAGDVVMAWVVPLHVGNFGGTGVKIAWFVLGLSPPLLFATGFIMWWTRVVRPRWFPMKQAKIGDAADT